MICVKTGCQLYSIEHGRYVLGDLYEFNGEFVLKARKDAWSTEPIRDRVNIEAIVTTTWELDGWIVMFLERSNNFSYDGLVPRTVTRIA